MKTMEQLTAEYAKATTPKLFTVEHVTHRYGAKDEESTTFTNENAAKEHALNMLTAHHGRVWINNIEFNKRELMPCIKY